MEPNPVVAVPEVLWPMIRMLGVLVVPVSVNVRVNGAVTDAEGVAHVASPRQKVELLALVPLFRLPTGRLLVTPLDRSTCAHAGLLVVPVLDKYRVALAFLARWFHVPVAEM